MLMFMTDCYNVFVNNTLLGTKLYGVYFESLWVLLVAAVNLIEFL